MLAYMAPSYTGKELATMTRHERATFNLLLVESGWAASFPIYPSLPRYRDLVLFHDAAKAACEEPRGAWTEPLTLTGYEFRMCVKLYDVAKKLAAGKTITSKERYGWISRYCADMTTREIFEPRDYYRVPAYNRIFIWPKDVTQAVGRLNLVPED